MENTPVHDIELYPYETFKVLLEHEVKRSRRYGSPLTLIHLAVETDASGEFPQQAVHAQHGAEIFAINALNIQLRETDIPCRNGNEFLVLMPSTDDRGGRIVCERLEKLFHLEAQVYDKVSFTLFTYIGMATLTGDRSTTTSRKLLDNAAAALAYARKNQIQKTVIYSETDK